MLRQSAFCQEKPNKSKDFRIWGMRKIHLGERELFHQRQIGHIKVILLSLGGRITNWRDVVWLTHIW